ncbi:MAG: inverse autotransporter beta domain-containing protein [Alphaproteobacteria bacterium]
MKYFPGAAAVIVVIGGTSTSLAEDKKAWLLSQQTLAITTNVAQGQDPAQAAIGLGQDAIRYWLPSLMEDAPDWAKRIEIQGTLGEDNTPEYSILTVQPLYQSEGLQDTILLQASQLRYALFGDYRDTTNLGLAYRRLLFDDSLMIGSNAFFDYEWTNGHRRTSIGAEVKFASLDFYFNNYFGLGNFRDSGNNTDEKVLDGRDVELRTQVPYLPWMRVGAKRYYWDADLSDDIKGWTVSTDMDLTQNVSMEIGGSDDNLQDRKYFIQLTVHLGNRGKPVMASNRFTDDQAFQPRDMKSHTLDKVRRQNKILVERRAQGVVIARGN